MLASVGKRVETGSVQFGEDWPGVFIRGDHAFHYAMHLETVLSRATENEAMGMDVMTVQGLLELLKGCQVKTPVRVAIGVYRKDGLFYVGRRAGKVFHGCRRRR